MKHRTPYPKKRCFLFHRSLQKVGYVKLSHTKSITYYICGGCGKSKSKTITKRG